MKSNKLEKLRAAVLLARRNADGVRVRYPKEVRVLVLEALRDGKRAIEIAKATGISPSTLFMWAQGADKTFREVEVDGGSASDAGKVSIILPNGIRVECASLSTLKQIMGWWQ